MGAKQSVELADAESISDLRVFLNRAESCSDGSVRFQAGQGVLRTTVCNFAPFGILDSAPTILGLRVFSEHSGSSCDAVLSTRGMLDRIAHLTPGEVHLGIPPMRDSVTWAGQDMPRGGWQRIGDLHGSELTGSALAGIAEVADALPEHPGELLVREVRALIWGASMPQWFGLPRGIAFAAHMLGFLGSDQPVAVFESQRWMRASTPVGHILVHQR